MRILYRVQSIFREVFDDPALLIDETVSVADLPGWDSVATVHIVLATEAEFAVRFTTDQVADIRSVADIVALLKLHTEQQPVHQM
jgi:acyl carrier protein